MGRVATYGGDMKVNCTECIFFVRNDEGYSNYTVMETIVDCLKGANLKLPAEESYDWETKNSEVVYIECPLFRKGEGPHFDVDREMGKASNYSDDPEVKIILALKYGDDKWF